MVMTIPRRGDDLEVGVVGLALGQRLERRPQELHAAVAERQVEGWKVERRFVDEAVQSLQVI